MPLHFIKSDNKIQILFNNEWIDTGLVEPLSQEDFEEYGMVDSIPLITAEQWAELGDEFEIIMWTDSISDTHKLELTVPEYRPIYLLDNPKLLTWTDSTNDLQIVQNVNINQQKRFLVSKDNRTTWWKLIYTLNEEEIQMPNWIQVPIENIYTDGMTKTELEAITNTEWKLWTGVPSTFNLDFAASLESANSENANPPTITSFEVNFTPNEAPLIQNPKLMVGIYELEDGSTIHTETVNLIADIFDQEGDQIRYKILINGNKVYPEVDEWTEYFDNNHSISKALTYNLFDIVNIDPNEEIIYLENEVTLVVQDDRGLERIWIGKIIIVNDSPGIVINHSDFSLTATLSDYDNDKVAYRILINNVQKFPTVGDNIINDKLYTPFYEQPKDISYYWSSNDLIFNEPNLITVEVIDEFGTTSQAEFSVIGTYKGLMFMDSEGNYYTTDSGEILKYLDFETIMAGTITEPKIVYLRNQNGFDVENTLVNINEATLPQGIQVMLSKVAEPFEDNTSLTYLGTLQDNESVN